MRTGRPWVRVKVAHEPRRAHGARERREQWITGEAAREDVQHWRARSSAVLTGIGTVLADDPRLDVRLPGAKRQPVRVVLDSTLRVPMDARLFDTAGDLIFFAANGEARRCGQTSPLAL